MKKRFAAVLLALSMLAAPVVMSENANVPFSINAEAESYTKLAKPKSVKAQVKDGKVTLSWKKVSGAEAYGVYKYDTEKKKYVKAKTVKGTKATVSLTATGTHKFRIYSMDKVNGKYKKGNYAYKTVKVDMDDFSFIDGICYSMPLGTAYEDVLKKLKGTDYIEKPELDMIFMENGEGGYYTYAFNTMRSDDPLSCWGFAYEDSDENYSMLCDLFRSEGWKAYIGTGPLCSIFAKDERTAFIYRDSKEGYVFVNIAPSSEANMEAFELEE